jgi:hypothetical protein
MSRAIFQAIWDRLHGGGGGPPPPPPPVAVPPRSWTKAQLVEWVEDLDVDLGDLAVAEMTKEEILTLIGDLVDSERDA